MSDRIDADRAQLTRLVALTSGAYVTACTITPLDGLVAEYTEACDALEHARDLVADLSLRMLYPR